MLGRLHCTILSDVATKVEEQLIAIFNTFETQMPNQLKGD